MKKQIIIFLIVAGALGTGCNKSILNLPNPNSPTPSSLTTEAGIESFAMGIFEKWFATIPGEGNTNIYQIVLSMHSGMGDEDFAPYSNWGLRYPANVNTIILPPPYNTVINNPSGYTQQGILEAENSVQAGEENVFQYEWAVSYYMNAQANLLLQALNNPALQISGDTATRKGLLRAWAYWWKAFAYSRVGSIYLSGIINNSANGTTNNNFVGHDTIIQEANRNFYNVISIMSSLTENADYDAVFENIVPSFDLNTTIITPAMWVRTCYTYLARNYLVNEKVANMQPSDWATITNLADSGMVQGDNALMWGMDPGGINDLTGNFYHPFCFHSFNNGFAFVSERFIQDYMPGDQRMATAFEPYPGGAVVNVRARGIEFGTRWNVVNIEDGGLYATENDEGAIAFGPTWEENSLMLAEADIRTGSSINTGLGLIDQVRAYQNAGLPTLAGSGISQDSAEVELHSEQRVGLYLRGLAFYYARRWGVTAPMASGGGRANANVLVPGTYLGGPSAELLPCFIEYDFLDYWDIPNNELNFNAPGPGSAPIKN